MLGSVRAAGLAGGRSVVASVCSQVLPSTLSLGAIGRLCLSETVFAVGLARHRAIAATQSAVVPSPGVGTRAGSHHLVSLCGSVVGCANAWPDAGLLRVGRGRCG